MQLWPWHVVILEKPFYSQLNEQAGVVRGPDASDRPVTEARY
jgi:hypothetical protein